MKNYICLNCGVQYNPTLTQPELCTICTDERQYVPNSGQQWTSLEELQSENYRNIINEIEPKLYTIKTVPQVGIGQNAYLITSVYGNYLWDCITYLDEDTICRINKLGGIDGIILSHPHYYSTIVEWAEKFECNIYIHENDKDWITRDSTKYIFWKGTSFNLTPEITIINLGGHFEGSSVLLWNGPDKKGKLLVGDTIFIVPDQGWVSFLYSHPNRIPLPSFEVLKIINILNQYEYESIYGAFDNIKLNGKASVKRSAERYIYHVDRKMQVITNN